MSPRPRTLPLLAALLTAGAAHAQMASAPPPTSSPVSAALRMTATRAQRNLVAAAEAMPADKYAYKPTDGHMTFAQHMVHVADFNEMMCGLVGGSAPAMGTKVDVTAAKTAIVERLRTTFASCATALASLDDARLGETVKLFGSDAPRATAAMILANDWSDHYAVTATYLRLNGVLPPTARR